ncbi:putative late blight resistance protein homolog R1A-3 [Lycium ferocissimum]|uniref:putative late blight resistance protein homolog R1A-3 n=1 Tax=Lycium ferocissimum TaxID=112874 RepID=UPI0028165F0B|nr:putative late blight resistance protein homolog R1A-3 [Lycium ferocissimum]
MERKAVHKMLTPLVKKIDAVKREVMRSRFGTNEVQQYVDPTNEDLQTEYRIRDLLLGVVFCVTPLTNEIKEESDDQLMDRIYKTLKGRRYLVVMDDIWSNEVWDLMTRTFPDNNNGSRIILSSRLKDVAMHSDPDSPPHEVSLLNAVESWILLRDKLFGVQKHVCLPELEDIGKKVAERCQGLPLALLLVAGPLSKLSRTPESWDDVSKRMGVFPEDSEVNIETLINLWVSEGFLLEESVGRDVWRILLAGIC